MLSLPDFYNKYNMCGNTDHIYNDNVDRIISKIQTHINNMKNMIQYKVKVAHPS